MPKKKLREAHELFARYYVACGNPAQAYRAAFGDKVDYVAAQRKAALLLKKPDIIDFVNELRRPLFDKLNVTAEMTLLGIARVAFLDPRRAFDQSGYPLPIHQLPDDVAAAISSIEVNDSDGVRSFKYKFNDRCKAHDNLAKIFAMYKNEEVKHDHKITINMTF